MEFNYENLDKIFKYYFVWRSFRMYTKCERQQCTGVSAEVNGLSRMRTPMFTSIAESVVAAVLLPNISSMCITELRQHWQGRLILSILSDYYFITSQRSVS